MNAYTFAAQPSTEVTDTVRINSVFGASSPLVLLFPGGEEDADYDLQRDLVARLREIRRENGEPAVRDITAMVTDGAEALKYYTVPETAALAGIQEDLVSMFFRMQGFGDSVRADRLLESAGPILAGNETVESLQKQLAAAKSAFEGPEYSRIVLEPAFRTSDRDFNACMEEILSAAESVYGDRFYVTGTPMSTYDIGNAFRSDLLLVNVITFLAILLIVTISFRSFRLPLLLVFVIEGAIWITMGISCLLGQPIFFISYLICLSIQMGATIDYGILLTTHYREQRAKLQPWDAVGEALTLSLPTLLTSGLALVIAGYAVGFISRVFYISSIGIMLGRGAIASLILVLLLLPCLLIWTDRFIIRKKDDR